jgi:hypothetical protein
MTSNENMKDFKIEKLLEMKSEIQREFHSIEVRMKQIKISQKQLELELWKKCNHKWVRDMSAADDDLCKTKCEICGLCNNRYLYV